MSEDRVTRILKVVAEEMQEWINDLLRDAFDPRKLMELVRMTGIDMARIPGMMRGQPGFDPYQILGLDKSASDEEVKKRYHELLHKLTLDTAGTQGTRFLLQMVMTAYETIKVQRGWQ